MEAVEAAFNQEKALVIVITNLQIAFVSSSGAALLRQPRTGHHLTTCRQTFYDIFSLQYLLSLNLDTRLG